jgi:hypothetical protein
VNAAAGRADPNLASCVKAAATVALVVATGGEGEAEVIAIDAAETAGTDVAEEAGSSLPTLEIDAQRMPNIARNIQSALDEGHPGILNRTTNEDLINANRAAACRGFCGPGSPDEYPFASTHRGVRERRLRVSASGTADPGRCLVPLLC